MEISDKGNSKPRERYGGILVTDMIGHREATGKFTPQEKAVLISEFQKTVEDTLKAFKCFSRKPLKDGYLALFERPTDLLQFALALQRKWQKRSEIPLRFAAHFGLVRSSDPEFKEQREYTDDSIDLAFEIAKCIETPAIIATESVVGISDGAKFRWEKWQNPVTLKGDCISSRQLWVLEEVISPEVPSLPKLAKAPKPEQAHLELAEKLFFLAQSLIGTEEELSAKQALFYELAIKFGFQDAVAYNNWGIALGEMGRHEEACAKFAEAVKHQPDCAGAYSNWGVALGKMGRHEEACAKFAEAVKHKPDFAHAYANQGEFLFYMKRFEEAETSLRRAVDSDEGLCAQAGFHIVLAATLAAQQKRQEALAELQVQEALSVESFEVDKPDAIFAALEPYKDDPEFAPLIENVREKLGVGLPRDS